MIRQIFDKYLECESLAQVVNYLTDEGIFTRNGAGYLMLCGRMHKQIFYTFLEELGEDHGDTGFSKIDPFGVIEIHTIDNIITHIPTDSIKDKRKRKSLRLDPVAIFLSAS